MLIINVELLDESQPLRLHYRWLILTSRHDLSEQFLELKEVLGCDFFYLLNIVSVLNKFDFPERKVMI